MGKRNRETSSLHNNLDSNPDLKASLHLADSTFGALAPSFLVPNFDPHSCEFGRSRSLMKSLMWWHTPVIPALLWQDGRQRQDNCLDVHGPPLLEGTVQRNRNSKRELDSTKRKETIGSLKLSSGQYICTVACIYPHSYMPHTILIMKIIIIN